MQQAVKLVIGLQNPGEPYAWTRHNIGGHVAELFAKKYGYTFRRERGTYTQLAKGKIAEHPIMIAKPTTYMNESGKAIQRLLRMFAVPLKNMLVIVDDIETPWKHIELAFSGGARGHNGIRNIHQVLGSKEFMQLRIGVGRPGHDNIADYVLRRFSSEEMVEMPDLLERAVAMVEEWLENI